MKLLAILLSICICLLHLSILAYRAISASTVNLYQILIYNTSGTNVEVTYLRVTHLTIRKTNVFTRSLKL